MYTTPAPYARRMPITHQNNRAAGPRSTRLLDPLGESAARRRMPAFFIAAVRSGPCGIARASSSAACASASKSSSGCLFLVMVKSYGTGRHLCLPGPRHGGSGRLSASQNSNWFLVRNQVSQVIG
jgi:hypothetical protein